MAKVVGIKFNHTNKVYYFAPEDKYYKKGEGVIVETARGVEYGTVAIEPKEVSDKEVVQPLKPILRRASKKDLEKVKSHEDKVGWIIDVTQKEVEKHELDMKVVDVEIPFDESKVIIYFTSPNRIDFRELVKSLAAILKQRIDLRQIGVRDEAKLLGGIAPCGRVCCCNSFLSDFKRVTIKMAKNQGLSLNPAKISGLCGKLMCCLEYENEPYEEVYKKMPKIGSEVVTPDGKAIVISNNMLKMLVKTKVVQKDGTITYGEYKLSDIKFKKPKVVEEDIDDDVDDN